MRDSWDMQDKRDPKYKIYDHEWGTSARQGYEDRPVFRTQPVLKRKSGGGTPLLNTFGGLLIVGGICWGTYLAVTGGGIMVLALNRGPLLIGGLGVVASVAGRFIR